ncbi:MAG: iron donor protein CyaY [Sandaracinaceae bacterium]|nr:iron donor protein CyaY [Sandaracinaceae bacterium]
MTRTARPYEEGSIGASGRESQRLRPIHNRLRHWLVEEPAYMKLADAAFRKLSDAFDSIDAEDADLDSKGDVITITFRNKQRCVINTQRPTRQIWLAGGQRAWHFAWDDSTQTWLDDKGSGAELFATIAGIAKDAGGLDLRF